MTEPAKKPAVRNFGATVQKQRAAEILLELYPPLTEEEIDAELGRPPLSDAERSLGDASAELDDDDDW